MPVFFFFLKRLNVLLFPPSGGMLRHHDHRLAFSPTGFRSVWQNKHNIGAARTLKNWPNIVCRIRLEWGHFHGNLLLY